MVLWGAWYIRPAASKQAFAPPWVPHAHTPAPLQVIVPACRLNLAPGAPTLAAVGPCGGATMNVTAAAIDPNGDRLSYQFVLLSSTGSVVSTGAWSTAAWASYSTTAAGGTLTAGRYTVQVRTFGDEVTNETCGAY